MKGSRIALGIGLVLAACSPAAVSAETGTRGATLVNVTAGKPSELHFTLSKPAKLSAGTVTFRVKNAGKAVHDFKLCAAPLTGSSAANRCAGRATRMLKPGQTTTLTIALVKSGTYEYLCSVPGHAAAGMKGLLTLAAAAAPAPVMTTAQAPAASPAATDPAAPATDDQTPPAPNNGFMGGMGGGGG
jgi:uncharacterized cupredoxin-like copper-binding protein